MTTTQAPPPSGGDGQGSGGSGSGGSGDVSKGGDKGGLAFTGVPVLDFLLVGLVVLLSGLVLVLAAKRAHRRRE